MLSGKVVLVTGATNGIGEVSAQAFAKMGATVVIVSRSADRCKATADKVKAETGNPNIDFIAGDLSTPAVQRVADEFLAKYSRLDVLLNNAGAVYTTRQTSPSGLEMTFALNHMSYFVLTNRLLDLLKHTAQSYGEARIINVSSDAHRVTRKLNLEDLQREKSFSSFGAYGDSKLMNILFTYELAKRLAGTGVTVNALHPGFVRTNFGKSNGGIMAWVMGMIQRVGALSPEDGAKTSIFLATSPSVKAVSGKYFAKEKAVQSSAISYDNTLQARLWEISEALSVKHFNA